MISNTGSYQQFPANGVTTQFFFNNKIFAAGDIVVTLFDTANPPNAYGFTGFMNSLLGLSYTVNGVDVDTGCAVQFNSAPNNLWTVDIRTQTPEIQATSIKNQGAFFPELHEEAFDRLTREVQDLYRMTYLFGMHGADNEKNPWPALPPPNQRVNTTLIFGGTGLPTVGTPINATVIAQDFFFYGTDSGAVNAYVVGISGGYPFSQATGVILRFSAGHANTGASTLNVSGNGAAAVVNSAGLALSGGEISSTAPTFVQWTGTQWQIVGGVAGSGAGIQQTPAEVSALVTPMFTVYTPGDWRRYGALTTLADNTIAAQASLNCSQYGQPSIVPPGIYKIASVNTLYALQFFSGTKLMGYGKTQSQILYTGAGYGHLLYGKNITNFECTGVWLYGNSQGNLIGYGYNSAIYIDCDNTAAVQLGNYEVISNRFDNWGGAYWFSVNLNSTTYNMPSGRAQNNDFYSYSGNCVNPQTSYAADCMDFLGPASASTVISDWDISGNTAYGQYLKRMVTIWGGTIRFNVHHNRAIGFGTNAFFSDTPAAWNSGTAYVPGVWVTSGGHTYDCILANTNQVPPNATYWGNIDAYGGASCYAFIAYLQANRQLPDEIIFDSNIVDGVLDCGFYIASCRTVTVSNNIIVGQLSSYDGNIPKGAIAFDGTVYQKCYGNRIVNCARGIELVIPAGIGEADCKTNQITQMPTSAQGIRVATNAVQAWSSSVYYSPGTVVTVAGTTYVCILANVNNTPPNGTYWTSVGNTTIQYNSCVVEENKVTGWVNSGANAIQVDVSATIGGKYLRIANNTTDAFRYGVFFNHVDAGIEVLNDVTEVIGNTFKVGNSGGCYVGETGHGKWKIKGNTFCNGGAYSNSCQYLTFVNSYHFDISDNAFMDFTSGTGSCLYGANCDGGSGGDINLANNTFMNVASGNMTDSGAAWNLGLSPPTTAASGTSAFVQDLNGHRVTSPLVATGHYVRLGWRWDYLAAAWYEVHAPSDF